ncbi:uncharacterized protein LOC144107090 [Amblyomma americanum]
MPAANSRVLHQLRGHVAGVNWRPTRLAEDVPTSRFCGLCQMIPKRTVQLPCSHFLCESCFGASSQDGGGICPLDREAFDQNECSWSAFPDRKLHALKVHCWNEARGCEFVGTMDVILRHYETECTFHTIDCPRCGDEILHKNLVSHYVTGCSGDTILGTTEQPSSQDNALTIQDVRAAVEEMKDLIRNTYQDQFPALQSQMNQLTEQSRSDTTRLFEAVRALTDSADTIKDQVSLIAGNMSSTLAQGHRSRGHSEESRGGVPEAAALPSPASWCTEKMLILRKLEMLTKSTLGILTQCARDCKPSNTTMFVRQKEVPFLAFDGVKPDEPLSSEDRLVAREYNFQLTNADDVIYHEPDSLRKKWAETIVWHRRDTYLELVVESSWSASGGYLHLTLRCFGLLESSHLISSRCDVKVLHDDPVKNCVMRKSVPACLPEPNSCYCTFWTEIETLEDEGFLEDGELRFSLVIYDETADEFQKRTTDRLKDPVWCEMRRQGRGKIES